MGPLTVTPRVEGWESLLATLVEEGRKRPFEWGVHDCATWAFDVRRALTAGEDVAARWRARYSTAAGARRMMLRLGWEDARAMGLDLLGAPLASPRLCQRGDIVLMAAGFGVVTGGLAMGLSPAGMGSIALTHLDLGWRV